MKIFPLALATALAIVTPAAAQQAPTLNENEREALAALNSALQARDYATATAALQRAQAAARSAYARYLASSLQLKLGIETSNIGLQQTAIDSMIGSGAAPAADLPMLYKNRAALFQAAGERDKAEATYARLLELTPGDAEAMVALAQVKYNRKKPQEAVQLVERAIAAKQAAGQPVPESWYQRALNLAVSTGMQPQAIAFARGLVAAYPSAANWRDVVLVYQDIHSADPAAALDAWRLMQAADALAGERDYLEFAKALDAAGFKSEANVLLDQAVAAKMVDPKQSAAKALIASTAKGEAARKSALAGLYSKAMAAASGTAALEAGDTHLAHREYAKAAELYRTALTKGSVDPALVNTHLGIALALAGQKAEAEAAFGAVTGPRGALAGLWLVWLGQRA